MSKRKSCRPWISRVGVAIDASLEAAERDAESAVAGPRSALVVRPGDAARSCGSHLLVGTSPARYCTRPDFESPCGASAVRRLVHVITGTIALNGTPLVTAFQTAPPPREMPSAPIDGLPVRDWRKAKSSLVSWTSRGPSRPKSPSEAPWPRASHASDS